MPTPTAYDWSERSQRYRSRATGRYIDSRTVRAEVDAVIEAQRARASQLTEQLFSRKVTLGAWQSSLEGTIKSMHLASAASAKGGFSRLTQADYGRVGQIVRAEYGYLAKFARAMELGTQPLNGRVIQRVNSYLNASKLTFEATKRVSREEAGFDLEINVLDPQSAHCVGCEEETDKGYVPIGKLTLPGNREPCKHNCNCWIDHARSSELEAAA